jgi:quinol monooxygenase YgiN
VNEPAGIVKMVAKDGRAEELLVLLGEMATVAATDDGCEIYAVHRSRAEPNMFFIYERYRDKDAMKLHHANTKLSEVGHGLRDLTESTELIGGNIVGGDAIRQ